MSKQSELASELFGNTKPRHLDGVPWHAAKRPFPIHKCRAQTTGFLGFENIQRCACGSIRSSTHRDWMRKNDRWIDSKRSRFVAPAIAGFIALVACIAVFMFF